MGWVRVGDCGDLYAIEWPRSTSKGGKAANGPSRFYVGLGNIKWREGESATKKDGLVEEKMNKKGG
jgi:hypothetical protein